MSFKSFCLIVFCSSLFFGCNSQKGPEETLRNFVNYRFSSSQDKGKTLSYVTGTLEEKIVEMSDEDYKLFEKTTEYKKKKLRINLKKCTENQCFITYTLSFFKKTGEQKSASLEVKKIAELKKTDKSWKIADVNNIKTYIESKEPIDVSPQ